MEEVLGLSIIEQRELLKKREISSEELVRGYLERIKKEDTEIKGYIEVFEEDAIKEARECDKRIKMGEDAPLLGIPLAIKDNISIKGKELNCASKILKGYIASFDATVIERLRGAGAIFLGRTNMDEFAMGSSTENSGFFITRNPFDRERVPGGSSGGSAAVVSANLASGALGSDTGGSIRQPAAFCGVVGLKPTYGRVSRFGLVAFASSLDQIGPITRTVKDSALILNIIAGRDPKDATSANVPTENYLEINGDIKGKVFGIPREYFLQGIDKEIEENIKTLIKKIESEGGIIEEISLPHTEYAIPTYYIVATAEASANLERYDGVKYGYRASADSLQELYVKTRSEGFGKEVKRRIMLGTFVLSSGYYEAYYLKALKVRTLIKEDFRKAFEKVSIILTPVTPTPPFKIGEKTMDPIAMYLSDIFTTPASLAGLPAISVPIGFTKNHLPIGIQLIAPAFQEKLLLDIALGIEKIVKS